ncbi:MULTISPECIES: hypothetical protein [unclassified Pseudomonas]|uniref:hypothetical protein n=1 Tax=unclassified Pseudomonas TaxID=196821 RepID=UPI0006D48F3C|nr:MULTISPECIES: hypothetical protein [unclassified Pseudomonas]
MTVYRDAEHAIARIMSIETIDGTKKADWQRRYESGWQEEPLAANPCPLSTEERLTQDAMTRALLHRELSQAHWNALVAKYSIDDIEVGDAVRWLVPRVVTPAHHLFRTFCVTAWAIPPKRGVQAGAKTSRRGLKPEFYEIHRWDTDGTPEGSLRRWKHLTFRWLEDQVTEGIRSVSSILEQNELIERQAA